MIIRWRPPLVGFGDGGLVAHHMGGADAAALELDMTLEVELNDVWTDITDDVELAGGLQFRRGISGNGPTDLVADGGQLSWTLDNSSRNEGGIQGWYSPNHTDCRSGWGYDIGARLTFTFGELSRVHFLGTIRQIQPQPGIYAEQRVRVVAEDLMADLDDIDLREIDIATDQTEDEVLDAILDQLPTEAMPASRDLDAGVDVFPYVFDRIGPDTKMASVIADAMRSSLGIFAIKGDGTPMYRSRHSLVLGTSQYTFAEIRNVVIPATLDNVFRQVRTVVHPKTIDPAATSVLYATEGTPPAIAPMTTLTIWGDYRDTTDDRTLIGGLDRVVPIAANTDYVANSAEDGTGSDETANITVVTSDFATTAKFEITNNTLATVYLTRLQIRGKRVLDIGAQTLQAGEETTRRSRPITIDLPLQSNPIIGQSAADYVRYLYSAQRRQIHQIEYMANYSDDLLEQFMEREIGDRITVTEEQTGLDDVDAIITSIDVEIGEAMTVICRYGLAPANTLQVWQLGVVGASELGQTTVLAF